MDQPLDAVRAGQPSAGPPKASSRPEVTPISAVAAGLTESRVGQPTSGADVAMDALLEEQVARQVRKLMQTHMASAESVGTK